MNGLKPRFSLIASQNPAHSDTTRRIQASHGLVEIINAWPHLSGWTRWQLLELVKQTKCGGKL